MSVPAAVQYRNLPPELELSGDQIDRLFLKVIGPATRVTANRLGQTALTLDLSGANEAGEHTFTISDRNLTLPMGVSLVRVVPSQVRVRLDRRVTKEVPVEVRLAGPPPPGYRVSRQEVQPGKLRIVGAEARLEQINSVQTDPVDLTSKVGEAKFRMNVSLPDPQVRFEQDSPVVLVSIGLEKIP
jgi:YbbR domain-containing protein